MADEKELSPEEAAKKSREDAVAEQDNPPQPYPTPEQLNKQRAEGGPIDAEGSEDDDDAEAKRKKAEADAAKQQKAAEPAKPAGGYQTR